jgi:hypothetical protein
MSQKEGLSKIAGIVLVAVLLLLPLQSLWLRLAEARDITDKPFFLLSFWYELVIFLIFFATLVILLWKKLRLTPLDWLFAILGLFALVSFFWSPHDFSYHIIGMRYSILPVYIYFLTRIAAPDKKVIFTILKWVFFIVIGVGVLQLLLLVTGADRLANALMLEITHMVVTVPQLYGSLPGPNQYGSYLLLILLITITRPLQPKWWLAGLAFFLLVLTFSRGAALGLVAAFVTGLVVQPKIWRWQTFLILLAAVIAIWVAVSLLFHGQLHDIFTHGASLTEHIDAFRGGIHEITVSSSPLSVIIGHGAGEAGPATFTRSEGRIQESWFLQIIYEYGLVGLILFSAIFCLTIIESMKQKQPMLAMLTTGLVANTLFLHVFSDNPAVTTLYFSLIALLNTEPLLINKNNEKQ